MVFKVYYCVYQFGIRCESCFLCYIEEKYDKDKGQSMAEEREEGANPIGELDRPIEGREEVPTSIDVTDNQILVGGIINLWTNNERAES